MGASPDKIRAERSGANPQWWLRTARAGARRSMGIDTVRYFMHALYGSNTHGTLFVLRQRQSIRTVEGASGSWLVWYAAPSAASGEVEERWRLRARHSTLCVVWFCHCMLLLPDHRHLDILYGHTWRVACRKEDHSSMGLSRWPMLMLILTLTLILNPHHARQAQAARRPVLPDLPPDASIRYIVYCTEHVALRAHHRAGDEAQMGFYIYCCFLFDLLLAHSILNTILSPLTGTNSSPCHR